jgi:hypothetical protein
VGGEGRKPGGGKRRRQVEAGTHGPHEQERGPQAVEGDGPSIAPPKNLGDDEAVAAEGGRRDGCGRSRRVRMARTMGEGALRLWKAMAPSIAPTKNLGDDEAFAGGGLFLPDGVDGGGLFVPDGVDVRRRRRAEVVGGARQRSSGGGAGRRLRSC